MRHPLSFEGLALEAVVGIKLVGSLFERPFSSDWGYFDFVTPTIRHFKHHPLANSFTYLSADEIDCPRINFVKSKENL